MASKQTADAIVDQAEGLVGGSGVLGHHGLQVTALAETTPLLAQVREARKLAQAVASNPQGFIASYAERLILWAFGPILERMPPINEDVDETRDSRMYEGLFLEVCILLKYSIPSFLYVI